MNPLRPTRRQPVYTLTLQFYRNVAIICRWASSIPMWQWQVYCLWAPKGSVHVDISQEKLLFCLQSHYCWLIKLREFQRSDTILLWTWRKVWQSSVAAAGSAADAWPQVLKDSVWIRHRRPPARDGLSTNHCWISTHGDDITESVQPSSVYKHWIMSDKRTYM